MNATTDATPTTRLPALTIRDVMAWEPCYDEDQIRALMGDRERMTALDALDLPIPADDRIWLVCHEEAVPAAILHEFACQEAEVALAIVEARGETVDPRSRAAVSAKRAWLRGEIDDKTLAAARDAAWAAAWDAARAAARDAAWAAAWDAAWAAAWDAARDAARDAAWAAAWDASIERLRSLLNAHLA